MSPLGSAAAWKRDLRSLLALGLPLVAGMGGHAFFNLVDLAMVGAYESEPALAEATIAGVTVASFLVTVPLVFVNGISNGTVAVIAQHFGAGKMRRANVAARQALVMCVLLSVLLGVVPALFAESIVGWFDVRSGVERQVAEDYFLVMSHGAFTGFLLMQITANMRAIGGGIWPMVLLLVSNVGNILGNFALIFGKWGFPELGAPGAAWATVAARLVSVVIGLLVLMRAHPSIRISLAGWKPRLRFLWQIASVGLPVAAQWTVRMASLLLILLVVSPFGASVKAAFGIGTRLDTLAVFAGLGWGGACAALLGQRHARGETASARRIAALSVGLNLAMMTLAGAVYWVWAEPLVSVFSLSVDDAADVGAVTEGARYLRISVFSYAGLAGAVVWAHALNGAGSVKTPMVIDTLGLLALQIPLAWWWAGKWGVSGAWWALVVSHSLIALVYYAVFRRGAWERKRLA